MRFPLKHWFRLIRLFLYYCSPCLIGLALVIGMNFERVLNVQNMLATQVCKQLQNPPSPPETPSSPVQRSLNVIRANGWTNCDDKNPSIKGEPTAWKYIKDYFLRPWAANSLTLATLTLFPFGILGVGLALKYHRQRVKESDSSEEKTAYLNFRRIAFKDFVLKAVIGFIIAFGWLYIFNPHGQAASAINDWLRNTDIVSLTDTAPNFFNFKDSSIKHALAAVFGWYLYLLGYFSYRFYKSDVLGTKVYNVLFKKFLFVIGVAFIISSIGATSNESLLLVFLIGFFPLSAVTLLTEFGNKRLSMGEDQTSLSILPGASTWQILRLEEEGIDSISALANSDSAALKQVISREVITPETLDTWIDQARLISVIGTRRWTELNGICERASEFVKKESKKDPAFITKLAEKSIFNADELSSTLQRNFKIAPVPPS
jgi:hypothetical protein